MKIDCGRFAANLDDAVARRRAGGFAARRAEAAGARQAARARHRLLPRNLARHPRRARRDPLRARTARSPGARHQSNGQGHETSYPQIAADLFGLPIDAFRFVQADTRAVKSGNGHGGARSMHMGGAALVKAAQMVIERAARWPPTCCRPTGARSTFADGRFTVGGSDRGIDLLDAGRAARDPANLPDGMAPGWTPTPMNDSDVFTFPNGCHAAEVEIDPETGAVTLERYTAIDDYGRLINPMLTDGPGPGRAGAGHRPGDARAHRLRPPIRASC